MNFNYDLEHDVLDISFDGKQPAYGDEVQRGIVVRRDPQTDEIVGLTITDFSKRVVSDMEELGEMVDYRQRVDRARECVKPHRWREVRRRTKF